MKEPIEVKGSVKAQLWATSEMKAIIHSESICRDLVPLSLCHGDCGAGGKAGPAQTGRLAQDLPQSGGPQRAILTA